MSGGAAQRLTRRQALTLLAVPGSMCLPLPSAAQTADEFGATVLRGAGSTFAHRLMSAWAHEYRAVRTGGGSVRMAGSGLDTDVGGVALDYEAVGSQAGIQRLRAGAVDFAVSEMPLGPADLQRSSLLQVPLVTGAVAVVTNPGVTSGRVLQLTPEVLAGIALGDIRTWNDPALVTLNPGLALPPTPITFVHRTDGSGTTFTFTQFLEQTSSAWQARVGSGLLVNWPTGTGHRGSVGVARAVAATPGALGYLDLVQARDAKLHVASLRNAHGRFVAPDRASVQASVAAAEWNVAGRFQMSLLNRGGERSYPIVAAVYALASDARSGARATMARAFLDWSVSSGRATAERLGYVALPASAAVQVRAALK